MRDRRNLTRLTRLTRLTHLTHLRYLTRLTRMTRLTRVSRFGDQSWLAWALELDSRGSRFAFSSFILRGLPCRRGMVFTIDDLDGRFGSVSWMNGRISAGELGLLTRGKQQLR